MNPDALQGNWHQFDILCVLLASDLSPAFGGRFPSLTHSLMRRFGSRVFFLSLLLLLDLDVQARRLDGRHVCELALTPTRNGQPARQGPAVPACDEMLGTLVQNQ